MEPDVIAGALEDDTLEIVVEDLARHAAERLEGEDVAAHETLERLVEREPRVDRTRPRKHHHEAGQAPLRRADLDLAEVSPVDLRLLAGQRLEPQERFGALRPNAADVAAQLHHRARIATRADHLEDARRAQSRVVVEDLADEPLVRVEHRRANLRPRAHEPVGLDRVADGVVVDAELAGDGAHLPMLGVEEAADLGLALLGERHGNTSRSEMRSRSRKSPGPPRRRRRWWRGRRSATPTS